MLPNRIAVYLIAAAGLATALAGAVANLDTSSSITLATGFVGIAGVVIKWLDGWQKDEERHHLDTVLKERAAQGEAPPAGQ